MIQFYITETGTYNREQLVDPSQAFVIDVHNKRLKLMENAKYVLEFQKLSDSYKTAIDSSDITGLSQRGAFEMYNDLLSAAGVTPEAVSQQINSSLIPVNASITTINSSVNTIEDKLDGIEEGAEKNVNPDWNATTGDASILNRPTLGQLAYLDSLSATDVNAIPNASFGVNGGVATLDDSGKVPSSQLPSYVDDVQEYDTSALFPQTGDAGIIYVAKDSNLTYRWGGSDYVEISPSLALGETSSTAYAGDKGKALKDAYDLHAADTDIHITANERTAWNNASDNSHTHSNKAILDSITDSSFHEHSNKTVLDGISSTDVANWNDASDNSHTHNNKEILDSIVDSSFHNHANKAILDGFVDASVISWNNAASKAHEHANADVLNGITDSSFHTHDNKTVIDGITTEKVAAWDTAATETHEHTNKTILDGIVDSSFHTHDNKSILDGITDSSIAAWDEGEANVNADWNATSGDSSILNRPTLGTAAAKDFVTTIGETASDDLVTDGAVKDYIGTLDFGVQSVGLEMPTGFTVTSSPITDDGSINVALTTGYAIPLNASLDNFELAYVAKHTHDNKTVLDGISSDDITNWNDASNAKHSHTNADILNGLNDTSVSNWNTAYTNNHTHSNKDILDGITDTSINDFLRDTSYGSGTAQEVTTGTDTTPKVWSAAVINEVLAEFDANAVRYKNDFNAETGVITDTDGKTLTIVAEKKGDMYVVSTDGTMLGVELQVGDSIIFKKNVAADTAPVASDITFVQGTVKVVNNDATLAWGSLVKVATVEGVDISVALPANPTDDYGTVVTKDYTDAITNDGSLNVVTGKAVKDYVDDTISKAHTHSNKAILDGITDTSISNWNTAYDWGNHATAGYAQQSYVQDVSTRLATTNTNVANVSTYTANVSTNLSSVNTTLTTRIANVSTYAINVSTNVDNVSTRLATTNTNVANVSTYAADVSTNLSTTDTKVNNVSTYAANVSTNLAKFMNDTSTNEHAWAAAWNQLFVLNPSLVKPSGTQYPV